MAEKSTSSPRAGKTPSVLTGDLGTGKTSVLRHLHDHPGTLSSVYIDMQDFDPGHRGEYGETASVGAVQSSFLQLRAALGLILLQVADDGSGKALARELQDAADRAYRRRVLNAAAPSAEYSVADLSNRIEPTALAKAWQRALKELCAQFLQLWNSAVAERKYLLLVDNWDFVVEQQIGISLEYIFTKMDRTSVVSAQSERELDGSAFITGRLEEAEVHPWLVGELGLTRPMAHLVFDVTTGHPATLVLAVALLSHRKVYSSQLTAFLESMLDQRFERRAGLMAERLARDLGGDALVEALQLSAVPRRFDAALLSHLLADQQPRLELSTVVTRLAAIYEPVPFPPRPAASAAPSEPGEEPSSARADRDAHRAPAVERFRMHSFVRNSILDRLSRGETAGRFEQINERVVEYFRDRVLDDEGRFPGVAGSYGKAYVYEDRNWQAHKREWLYHRSLTSNAGAKRKALQEFATVFLDAFYWWGYYIRFEFCEQLVTDLEHLADRRTSTLPGWDRDGGTSQSWPELVELHRALRTILEKYPTGSEKPARAAWGEIRDSLYTVSTLCRVNDDRRRARLDEQGAHLAGVICIIVAHTFRYQDPQQAEADEYYERATQLLTERWMKPWLALERGELSFEAQQVSQVEAHWRAAMELLRPTQNDRPDPRALGQDRGVSARLNDSAERGDNDDEDDDDEDDKEVLAWLFSLRANCAAAAARQTLGEDEATNLYLRAATWHGRAVWHAYLFHFSVGPPDAYTLEFYVDMRRRALNFLLALPKGNGDALKVACAIGLGASASADSRFRPREGTELLAAIGDASPVALAHALFPRGPDVDELTPNATKFSAEYQSYLTPFRRLAEPELTHQDLWP